MARTKGSLCRRTLEKFAAAAARGDAVPEHIMEQLHRRGLLTNAAADKSQPRSRLGGPRARDNDLPVAGGGVARKDRPVIPKLTDFAPIGVKRSMWPIDVACYAIQINGCTQTEAKDFARRFGANLCTIGSGKCRDENLFIFHANIDLRGARKLAKKCEIELMRD